MITKKKNVLLIGKDEIKSAREILFKYKRDKSNLDEKIISNEQWWKLRNWEQMRVGSKSEYKPTSAWLWNIIVSKHADAMEVFPEANFLPRASDDIDEATNLTSIMPVILEQNNFESVYSDVQWYKLKQGTGVYGVFWDKSKNGGLGDITVKKIDVLSLFWESGVNDIQDSENVFCVSNIAINELQSEYPEIDFSKIDKTVRASSYIFDDNVDMQGKIPVVDWYYRKKQNGRRVLHYCKFAGDEVLFATENEPEIYPNGWYDHGLYPFVFDSLFKIEGTPCGYGYIDVGKDAQKYIDLLNQAIIDNALMNARPRYFIRSDGSVNEEEFADFSRDFVHTDSNLGKDSIMRIEPTNIDAMFVSVLNGKISELKETTGNRDVLNGGTISGVTAASAIAALQEAGGKISRDSTIAAYGAFKEVVLQCVELIRQFYDAPRQFRINGRLGENSFIHYSNEALVPHHQGFSFGVDLGYRLPVFDIEISAQKANPYTKITQNELALQFYNLGFFNPENAEIALACLEMMDFPRKEGIMQKISENALRLQTEAERNTVEDWIKLSNVERARVESAQSVIPND